MLEVRYQNDLADLRTIARVWSWPRRLGTSLGWLSLLAACGLPPTLLLAMLGNWLAIAAGWVVLLGLLPVAFTFLHWKSQRATMRELQARLRPTTIRIGPEGFEAHNERGRGRCDWSAFEHVVVRAKHIYLVTEANTVHVIPKRAFDSPAQADAFGRAAVEFHQSAGQSTGVQFTAGDPPRPAEGDTLQVTYRNTPAEFASVQFEGLKKSDQPPVKKSTWGDRLLFIFLGIVFAFVASWTDQVLPGIADPVVEALIGLVAFVVLVLPAMGSIQWISRRFYRTMFEKRCRHEQTLTISSAGISRVQANGEGFSMWEEYSSVEEDDWFVVFFEQNRTHISHLIPKQAFASADDAARFVSVALRQFERAHPPPAIDAIVLEDTGNPYQAPAAR